MKTPIYLDNNATTPMDPRVLETMLPYFTEKFGNASSKEHVFGWESEKAVAKARKQIAKLINADPSEIIFTSGATESINLAHFGVMESYFNKGNKIITTEIEHPAVIDSLNALKQRGCDVVYLKVNHEGEISIDDLINNIDSKTVLVSIMTANNEIGVINPVSEIGKICRSRNIFFHTDATQAIGNISFDVVKNNVDLLSCSAHKFYGPKGTGALYINKNSKIKLSSRNFGGGQEKGLRPGTLNTPGIVGLGKAAEIASEEMESNHTRIKYLRDKLYNALTKHPENEDINEIMTGNLTKINGTMDHRLPGNLNISWKYLKGESIILALRDIAVSSGAACSSATLKKSHVLAAIEIPEEFSKSSIRFGIGRFNTEEEIDYVIGRVTETIKQLISISPEYQLHTK